MTASEFHHVLSFVHSHTDRDQASSADGANQKASLHMNMLGDNGGRRIVGAELLGA